jgi:DNA repair protein RadD
MTTLRPYQVDAVEALRRGMAAGIRRQLLVSPTGSGKGTLLASMIAIAVSRGKHVLFVVAGRQLVAEFSERLWRQYAVDHGVVMAGHERAKPWLPVQVASVDTLASHIRRGHPLPAADLVIVDEADLARANRFEQPLAAYPNAFVIGCTATPVRADGKGLGSLFQSLHVATTPRELIEAGYLARYDGWAFEPLDTSGVRTKGGDFDADALDLVLQGKVGEQLAGDIVKQWHAHAVGRRTVLFAVSRRHSRDLVERFNAERVHGAPIAHAEHVDGEMPFGEREAVRARILAGETQVVCNVGVLCRGVDWPALEVAVFARPTKSLALYLQQAGRVFRTSPETGKSHATFLDHAGNIERHGAPDEDREWSLAEGIVRAREGAERLSAIMTCKCRAIFETRLGKCPSCGKPVPARSSPDQRALTEITEVRAVPVAEIAARRTAGQESADARRLESLVRSAILKGRNLRWAGHVFAGKDKSQMPDDAVLERIAANVREKMKRQPAAAGVA